MSVIEFVIEKFQEKNPSPRDIAAAAGFGNHFEMAAYMARNGYKWSMEENNYVKCEGIIDIPGFPESETVEYTNSMDEYAGTGEEAAWTRYKDVLDFLYKEHDTLKELLKIVREEKPVLGMQSDGKKRISFFISSRLFTRAKNFCESRSIELEDFLRTVIERHIERYC
jgi:hypothetical protein